MLNKIKKHWITAWLLTAIIASAIFVTYAAYTEVSSVKRVVSTKSTPETLFSSNCMRKDGSRKQMSSQEYTVTVCNFDQNYPGSPNKDTITYTFTARLELKVGDHYYAYNKLGASTSDGGAGLTGEALTRAQKKISDNASKYGVQMTEDDEGSVSDSHSYKFSEKNEANYEVRYVSESLKSNEASTDKFKVNIPADDLNNPNPELFVYVEADPTDHTLLYSIYSRLYGAEVEQTESLWTGKILETDCKTVDYDFYNYILTGNGEGTVDIMWDPRYLEISDFFTNELSGNRFAGGTIPVDCSHTLLDDEGNPVIDENGHEVVETWKKLTLVVNATDQLNEEGVVTVKGISRYEIQFFKVKENNSYTGDNAASKYLDYKFNKSQP